MTEKKLRKTITASLLLVSCYCHAQVGGYGNKLIKYVQPLSGTAPSTTISATKHSETGSEKNANTIPAVAPPFAMTQWSPQTRQSENKCLAPYYYQDTLFTGFRSTHWLSGSCTQDYGSFTLMPVIGKLRTQISDYALPLSHQQEESSPTRYALRTGTLLSEVTATPRCGLMRFTLEKADSLYLLVIPNSDREKGFLKVDEEKGEIWGYNPVHRIYQGWGQSAGFNGWFYLRIDHDKVAKGAFRKGKVFMADSIVQAGADAGLYLGFALQAGESLTVRIGTSFTGVEAARMNLHAEIGNKSFDDIVAESTAVWEEALGQITIEATNETHKRIFYTAQYHAMQHPRLMSDVGGTYPSFSRGNVLQLTQGAYFDDFSMWDIYRAHLPLLEITMPSLVNDLVRSLILKGQQGGWLPIFPCWNSYTAAMIGDHSTAFIASAFNRGIRNYDIDEAYRLMRKNAFEVAIGQEYSDGMGRRALPSYLKYGYIPLEDSVAEAFHKKEQVSRTLEYAFDDYALATVAKGIGHAEDHELLYSRALNYRKVFDPTVNMVRGRYANGDWWRPFRPDQREPYITEGTPRQYTFYVPHDIPGLASMMGGDKILERSLDSLFLLDEYWHGNEPGHQIPFLYNYTPSPWKGQQAIRKIREEEYGDGPGGLSGNDDAGQMSAWYVFAALGFYPVDPVSGYYQLTAPLFDKVALTLDNGILNIVTHKTSPNAAYIDRVHWNGKHYGKNYVSHDMISGGGVLEFWLTDTPSNWGASAKAREKGLAH